MVLLRVNAKNKKIIRCLAWILFCIYIASLVYFLFFCEKYGRVAGDVYRYNLRPFSEIGRYFKYMDSIGYEFFFLNILGNVIAFVPYGILLPIMMKHFRSFVSILINGLLFTVCIETVQLMFRVGSFDVDDIIMNISGIIIGYFIYKIVRFINKRIENKG